MPITIGHTIETWPFGLSTGLLLRTQRAPGAFRVVSNESEDAILIEETMDGNERAFRILVERYQESIVRTVTGMLGETQDVDDTVQEVFIRFHAALRTFRAEASVKTFLTRIAINRSLDVLRKRKRQFFVSWEKELSEDIEAPETHPDEAVIEGEERHHLRKAVDTLSPRHRAVVVLRLIDGLSTREAAEVLGVPYGTVLSRLKRALTKLKEHLGDDYGAADLSPDGLA